MPLREVAQLLGISYSRAQQLEQSALAKLRKSVILRQLAQDYGIDPSTTFDRR